MRCGAFTEHASGLCGNCEASSGYGAGTPADVPCQRCGMYLPSHELKMWNSRLYCSYCIMDIQDEEKMGRREKRRPERESGDAQQEGAGTSGVCEQCGKQSGILYVLSGRRLCQQCFSASGGEAGIGWLPHFGQIILRIKKAIGIKPKIIVNTAPAAQQGGASQQSEQSGAQAGEQVFGIKNRQMEDRKSDMEAQSPISEEKRGGSKPSRTAKKFFFGMHPAAKGKEGSERQNKKEK